jgi:hypothetical protein
MFQTLQITEAILSGTTFIIAFLVAYRALKGYRIAFNINLLFLGAGFILLGIFFLLSSLSFLGVIPRGYPYQHRYLYDASLYLIQFAAYLLIMLAYVIQPRFEETAVLIGTVLLSYFLLNAVIVILLAITAGSVMIEYRRRQTASTALVLSSFALLFIIHLLDLFLIFIPHILILSTIYTVTFELLSFTLLFIAIERPATKGEQSS